MEFGVLHFSENHQNCQHDMVNSGLTWSNDVKCGQLACHNSASKAHQQRRIHYRNIFCRSSNDRLWEPARAAPTPRLVPKLESSREKKNCGQRWTWIGHRKATDRKSYKWEMKWQNWKRRGRIGNQWKWTGIKEGIHSFMEKENANKWGTEWTKNGSESCREKVDNKQARGWHLNAKTQSGIPGSAVYDGNSKNHWHTKNSWFPRKNSYPLVNIQKAIENGHRNSGFTMIYPLKMVDLSIVMWQFTRGYLSYGTLRHRSSLLQFFRSSENRLTVGPPAHRNKRWKRWPPGADGQFVKSPSKGVGKPGVSFFGIENHYPLVI